MMAKFLQRIWYGCAGLAVLLLTSMLLFYRDMQCAVDSSVLVLNHMCKDFADGKLMGNLCEFLCDGISFEYDRCANYQGGKVTILGRMFNRTMVLKAKRPFMNDYDPVYYSTDAYINLPSYKEFNNLLRETLKYNLNVDNAEFNFANRLWTFHLDDYMDNSKQQLAAMQSLWSLVQQDEYLYMKHLAGSRYVPQIYGSCGHVYAMEYSPPGSLLNPDFLQISRLSDPPWDKRVMLALLILELVRYFDEQFHEKLHICDVKGDNFGVTLKGALKVIDWDMVMFDSRLNSWFEDFNCSHTNECAFLDCYSTCDTGINRCIPQRINTNLQIICQHILVDSRTNMYRGLLRDPPPDLRTDLRKLLTTCASLSLYHRTPVQQDKAAKELNQDMYELLLRYFQNHIMDQSLVARVDGVEDRGLR